MMGIVFCRGLGGGARTAAWNVSAQSGVNTLFMLSLFACPAGAEAPPPAVTQSWLDKRNPRTFSATKKHSAESERPPMGGGSIFHV